jgi:hypothetical protein
MHVTCISLYILWLGMCSYSIWYTSIESQSLFTRDVMCDKATLILAIAVSNRALSNIQYPDLSQLACGTACHVRETVF